MKCFQLETPGRQLISLEEARNVILSIPPLPSVHVNLRKAVNLITAEDIVALSNCPSADVSMKDGYAVFSSDIQSATQDTPVKLHISGTVTAGQKSSSPQLTPGHAIRIMTGSTLPVGATAVLASEFAEETDENVQAFRDAEPGRNILTKGQDVAAGTDIIQKGTRLTSGCIGLLAAGGIDTVPAIRQPRVMIAAIGNELVSPGKQIGTGEVAASNMVTLEAELLTRGIPTDCCIIRDNLEDLHERLAPLLSSYDILLTCGGVLDGDKDYTMRAMDDLGVKNVFKRVRVGPGKGTCFGYLDDTLVFNLPGGPPSNHIGFLMLALPGILCRNGLTDPFMNRIQSPVTQPLYGQKGWTQIVYGQLQQKNGFLQAHPLTGNKRLSSMAAANCLIEIPENKSALEANEETGVWKIS